MKKFVAGALVVFASLMMLPTITLAVTGDYDSSTQSTACTDLKNNLRYRSTDAATGGDVSSLQSFLQDAGFLQSEPTGFLGRMSIIAIQKYQESVGLDKTGYVGPLTRAKIKSQSCGGQSFETTSTIPSKNGSLTISVSATPPSQTIVAGGTGQLFANYQLNATQSSEDVYVSPITLALFVGGKASQSDLFGCRLFDGNTALNTADNVVNPTYSDKNGTQVLFTLDKMLLVSKGTIKTLSLKCNVSANALPGSTYAWGISTGSAINASGVTTSNSITPILVPSNGQVMTIAGNSQGQAAGTLTVTTDASSPAYRVVSSNTLGNIVGAYKFHASNEAISLNKISLDMPSGSTSDLSQVSLWDGQTQVGSALFVGTNKSAVATLAIPVMIPKDSDKVITVKADMSPLVVPGDVLVINATDSEGVGQMSGATIKSSKNGSSVAGVKIYKSLPTFTYNTTGATLISGVNDLLKLTVFAPPTGEIQLYKLTFTYSTNGATISSPTFSGPNGNVSSVTNSTMSGNTISVYFDSSSNISDRIIPAGQSKTFTLRGTVIPSGQSVTVTTALKADTAPLGAMNPASVVDAKGSGYASIIWSPSSTTTASFSTNDWNNGYGINTGCFASVGLGNDCYPRVIDRSGYAATTPTTPTSSTQTPTEPTAQLLVNGVKNGLVSIGDKVTYTYSAQNADQFSGSFTTDKCYTGPQSIPFDSASGSYTGTFSASSAGCTYTVTYTVRQSSTGKTSTATVTVYVAPPAGPTAQLLANGVPNALVSVGQKVTYTYSAQNADQFSGSFVTDKCYSGVQPMPFDSASGSYTGTFSASSAGCTFTVSYTAKQSSTGKTVTATATVYVAPQTVSATPTTNVSDEQIQNLANAISALRKLVEQLAQSQTR